MSLNSSKGIVIQLCLVSTHTRHTHTCIHPYTLNIIILRIEIREREREGEREGEREREREREVGRGGGDRNIQGGRGTHSCTDVQASLVLAGTKQPRDN